MSDRSVSPSNSNAPRRAYLRMGRINSLGLSKRDLDRLLDEIDGHAPSGAGGAVGRRFIRRPFRQVRLPMQVRKPGDQAVTFPVACRNISCTGISVLHSAFIHPGTPCTLVLPSACGDPVTVTGTVVRCQHLRGMVHEVGVAFDNPIDLHNVLGLERVGDWFSLERIDPGELTGTLLCVDDCAVDRQLIRYHLQDTSLLITSAEDSLTGLAKASTGFDIILCAYHMPVLDGPSFVEQLRSRGITTPVILLAHDADDAASQRLSHLSNVALLIKPVPRDLLLRALAEFLIVSRGRDGHDAHRSTGLPTEPMGELIAAFLQDLPRLGDSLKAARDREDAEACRQICLKVRGGARALGLVDLAYLADLAASRLTASTALADAAHELDRLLAACRISALRRAS